jgi:hypothetical protein
MFVLLSKFATRGRVIRGEDSADDHRPNCACFRKVAARVEFFKLIGVVSGSFGMIYGRGDGITVKFFVLSINPTVARFTRATVTFFPHNDPLKAAHD